MDLHHTKEVYQSGFNQKNITSREDIFLLIYYKKLAYVIVVAG